MVPDPQLPILCLKSLLMTIMKTKEVFLETLKKITSTVNCSPGHTILKMMLEHNLNQHSKSELSFPCQNLHYGPAIHGSNLRKQLFLVKSTGSRTCRLFPSPKFYLQMDYASINLNPHLLIHIIQGTMQQDITTTTMLRDQFMTSHGNQG